AHVCAATAPAAAQTVVAGRGDPKVDVAALRAAVGRGGEVVLKGHFSFERAPTKTDGLFLYPGRMVLVSKEVTISGARDDNGAMTTIYGGIIPFLIEAPGSHVTFQKLCFVHPKRTAIAVSTAGGLEITSC